MVALRSIVIVRGLVDADWYNRVQRRTVLLRGNLRDVHGAGVCTRARSASMHAICKKIYIFAIT